MSTLQSPMSKPALKYSVITYLMLSAFYLKVHWPLQAASTTPAEVWPHQSMFTAQYPLILSEIRQADAKGDGVAFQLEACTKFHHLHVTLHYPGVILSDSIASMFCILSIFLLSPPFYFRWMTTHLLLLVSFHSLQSWNNLRWKYCPSYRWMTTLLL